MSKTTNIAAFYIATYLLDMSSHTTDLYVKSKKFIFEWPESRLPKIQDTVDYLSARDVGEVVAVWESKQKRNRRRHSSILDNPQLYFGM